MATLAEIARTVPPEKQSRPQRHTPPVAKPAVESAPQAHCPTCFWRGESNECTNPRPRGKRAGRDYCDSFYAAESAKDKWRLVR